MITKIKWHGLEAIEFSAAGYEALLVPSIGANLVRLYDVGNKVDILRTPTAGEIATFKERPQIFGLPLLFPPNRIEDGTYTHNGVTYQYPITIPDQNNYHHGNIKSIPFNVTKTEDADGYALIEASFISNAQNDQMYRYFPHDVEFRMSFHLSAQGLKHTVTVTNLGDTEMPLGLGYHTPINMPFSSHSSRESYKLRLSVGKRWKMNSRTLPTGELLELTNTEKLLREDGLSPIGFPIEWALTNEPMSVDGESYSGAILTDMESGVSVFYEIDDQMKHWTLWNNGGDVDWLCPEPQTWAINAPNLDLPDEVTGFQVVAPHSSWSSISKIYVKKE